MSIGSIGGNSALNQIYASRAQSVLASFDPETTASTSTTAIPDSSSNALTGVSTGTLDSQTLQALMNLTQQDPSASSDPSETDAPGQAGQTGQTQGAHHHHHHHGGGGMTQAQPTDSSASLSATSSTTTAASTDAFGVPETDADSSDESLAAALSQA